MSIIGPREASNAAGNEIRITPEISAQLEKAVTSEEIKKIMYDAAISQGVAERNLDGELVPTALAANPPKKFAKVITVNGVKSVLEADSPEGLAAAETAFWQSTVGQKNDAEEQPRDPSTGRFVEQQAQVDPNQQALDAAVTDYLTRQGIDPEALKTVSDQKFQNSWKASTDEYLRSAEGAGWEGGEANVKIIAELIETNGLMDKPSAETLAQVIEFARENNLLVANPEAELSKKLASAGSPEEINDLLGRSQRNHYEGGFFGGR